MSKSDKIKKAATTMKVTKAASALAPGAPLETAEVTKPGGTLMAWLVREASQKGHTLVEMATELGVTYGYIAQLRSGIRHVQHISEVFAESCAKYLGVPAIAVKIASGRVRLRDFILPEDGEKKFLEQSLRRIQMDPMLGGHMPPEVFGAHQAVQHFILLCFQEVSGQQIYPSSSLPCVLHDLKKAVRIQTEREDAIEDFLATASGHEACPSVPPTC